MTARQPRFETDRRTQRDVTERFLAACLGGDLPALVASMSPDVVLVSDGGGRASAARRPVTGADRVARFLVGIAAKPVPRLRVEVTDVNGAVGVVAWSGDAPYMGLQLQVVRDRIAQVLLFVNPDKLAGLAHG